MRLLITSRNQVTDCLTGSVHPCSLKHTHSHVPAECKVIVVGNGQVGKTSMITRFAKGVFTNSYKKTVGTDFMERDLFLRSRGETVKLLLWDTAGQEMFSQLTRQYYRGARVC